MTEEERELAHAEIASRERIEAARLMQRDVMKFESGQQ